MEIVAPKHDLPLSARIRKHRRLVFGSLLLVGWSLMLVAAGATMYKNGFFSESVMPFVRNGLDWPRKRVKAFFAEPKHLAIDIKWEHRQQLAHQRQVALDRGALNVTEDDFVPATMKHDGDKAKIRLRLKGDGVDHLLGDKWSYRVRVTGDDTVFGMKQFSLHHPRVRNWAHEWLGLEAMRRGGIVALRYDFVDVSVNGKSLGIYALEEHFEKRLIEHNERREGPILRFGEDLMWNEIVQQVHTFPGSRVSGAGKYHAAEVDGFQTSKTLADENLRGQYLTALSLLERFRRGELTTTQTFDVAKTATYFALVDLFGGEHGARWNNIRFYYNPVISRLEPIAFDLAGGKPTLFLSIASSGPRTVGGGLDRRLLGQALFEDIEFSRVYISELERVSDPAYLEELLEDTHAEMEEILAILYTEFPYYEFSPDVLRRNQAYIRSVIEPVKGIHAYLAGTEEGRALVDVGSIQSLPVEILALEVGEQHTIELDQVLLLRQHQPETTVDYQRIEFDLPGSLAGVDLVAAPVVVAYRILGSTKVRRAPAALHAQLPRHTLTDDVVRVPPNADQFAFVRVNEANRVIRIAPGEHTLDSDLILPAGFVVECGPSTVLDLVDGALILSRSPLSWTGRSDGPVVVRSTDGTGQGLLVLQADGMSSLEHVVFEGLTNPQREGWSLTGAVTFYESTVELSRVQVLNNSCEDGLNLVRTEFEMEECTFADAFGDAFDADFCKGKIAGTTFLRSSNDAIDVSGSEVLIDSATIRGCGDKAVSVGEGSSVTAKKLSIEDARIGLASKDLSSLIVSEAHLTGCQYGLAAFQKKTEFGPATLVVKLLEAQDVGQLYLIEEGSSVIVGGQPIEERTDDVHAIVYGLPTDGTTPESDH